MSELQMGSTEFRTPRYKNSDPYVSCDGKLCSAMSAMDNSVMPRVFEILGTRSAEHPYYNCYELPDFMCYEIMPNK